jgi:hypothetical protein
MRAGFNHKGTGGNEISVVYHDRTPIHVHKRPSTAKSAKRSGSSQRNGFLGFVPEAQWTPLVFFASFAAVLRDLRG